jgi:uncharacterized membrane protein YoaK (UPF0700 family)
VRRFREQPVDKQRIVFCTLILGFIPGGVGGTFAFDYFAFYSLNGPATLACRSKGFCIWPHLRSTSCAAQILRWPP